MPHKTIQRIIGTHFSSPPRGPSPSRYCSRLLRIESQTSHTRDRAKQEPTPPSAPTTCKQAGREASREAGREASSQLVSQAATQSATPVKLLGAYVRRHKINK